MADRITTPVLGAHDSHHVAETASSAEVPPSHVAAAIDELRSRNGHRIDDFDNHIPKLSDYVSPKKRDTQEQRNVDHLARILSRHGWEVHREVPISAPDSRFRADLLVTHPRMRWEWGAVEVKGSLRDFRTYCDASKQAQDYTGCQILGRTDRVKWAAVWPHPDRDDQAADHWAVHKYLSLHHKVLAMCQVEKGWDSERACVVRTPDAAKLVYSWHHVVWSTRYGFVDNHVQCALGKRQVGGQRL